MARGHFQQHLQSVPCLSFFVWFLYGLTEPHQCPENRSYWTLCSIFEQHLPKNIRTCSAQVHFLRPSSEISALIMAIWSYFTGEGSVSKASLCSSWSHHTLTALSLLLSEGHQYLLPGLALQQPNKRVKSIQLLPGQTKCSQAVPVIVQNPVGISRELEICWNKKSLILSCLFCHTMLHCSAAKQYLLTIPAQE